MSSFSKSARDRCFWCLLTGPFLLHASVTFFTRRLLQGYNFIPVLRLMQNLISWRATYRPRTGGSPVSQLPVGVGIVCARPTGTRTSESCHQSLPSTTSFGRLEDGAVVQVRPRLAQARCCMRDHRPMRPLPPPSPSQASTFRGRPNPAGGGAARRSTACGPHSPCRAGAGGTAAWQRRRGCGGARGVCSPHLDDGLGDRRVGRARARRARGGEGASCLAGHALGGEAVRGQADNVRGVLAAALRRGEWLAGCRLDRHRVHSLHPSLLLPRHKGTCSLRW